jgi:hypothetical protein
MHSSFRSALVLTAVAAIALTSFGLRPAGAAPKSAIAKQHVTTELSAVSKKRRYRGNPFPYAAVGAIIGSIANIAAAQSRPAYYYDNGPYVDGAYVDGPAVYGQPYGYYDEPAYDDTPPYIVPGGYAPHRYRGFVSPGPVHRPFVGRAPAARQFEQRNFIRPQGGGRVGAPGGRPHNRH